MKTILIIALIAMFLTGFASASSVDMSIYDRNDDMQIDAAERTVLDIDIEGCRLTPAEIKVIDLYTIDGTIILNDEFQAVFLNPEGYYRSETAEITVTPDPVLEEPILESIVEPVNATPEIVDPVDESNNNNATAYFVIGMVILASIIMYIYFKQNKLD